MVVPLWSMKGRRRCNRDGVYLTVAREEPESGEERAGEEDRAK